ncbi:uncharacterized protein Culd isoform X2 [Euwallacea fornicatus]|uniref:uncharacterized protein Culd isoform X2 n=1 Tax=Euwallacea fornicatus TaxID=995702 RepID=UPI00338FB300
MVALQLLWFITGFKISIAFLNIYNSLDICAVSHFNKLHVDYGTSGELLAEQNNQPVGKDFEHYQNISERKCIVELITCPSCVIRIKFLYLNISRTCQKSSVYSHCGCNYVLLHQPSFEEVSAERFCGNYVHNNVTELTYISKTRTTIVTFQYTRNYGHAFTLQFFATMNREVFENVPRVNWLSNSSQTITSPFFPYLYPADLIAEYVVNCRSKVPCRISLSFTDFIIADSSILEFFDWNGQRLYVISGALFRPPVIATSGPTLLMRFYANGASDFGFKASYYFSSENLGKDIIKPNTDCGGQVNNVGGGITMMNMVANGSMVYDCIWIVKIPLHFLHRKTHLYVKIVHFQKFGDSTELLIRNGSTSLDPIIEVLKYPPPIQFNTWRQKEHVVPINQGFYISLRGSFNPQSQMAIVYAAFSYKECFSGLDFLCNNGRCISTLLNCDGFDHCGDFSDESLECQHDPKDHRKYSEIPNFLFPKVEPYADLTMISVVFLLCTFGFIGVIFALALLLYRVNLRTRNQRRIQEHINTIHAILDLSGTEGANNFDEEIIIPDEPPDYEPPPEYSDVFRYIRRMAYGSKQKIEKSTVNNSSLKVDKGAAKSRSSIDSATLSRRASLTRNSQTSPVTIPDTSPPAYENVLSNQNVSGNMARGVNNVDEAGSSSTFCIEIGNSDFKTYKGTMGIMRRDLLNSMNVPFHDISALLEKNFIKYKSTLLLGRRSRVSSTSDQHLSKSVSDPELMYEFSETGAPLTRRSLSSSDLYRNLA